MTPRHRQVLLQYGAIATGAIGGSLLRQWLEFAIPPITGTGFPIATLAINLSGSLFLAWFYTITVWKFHLPQWVRVGLGTGFVGSYTTFSTFMVETNALIGRGEWQTAFLYAGSSVIGGLAAGWAGVRLAGERREERTEKESPDRRENQPATIPGKNSGPQKISALEPSRNGGE